MKAYNELVDELDSSGARYSQDLSEVDLSDLENLKVRTNDPAGDVLIELGSSDYLKRYQTYVSHVQQWRQQFQKLESVNLRYDNQVIVNPDLQGGSKQSALAASAAKAAVAAGVKPAALTTRLPAAKLTPTGTAPHDRALPKPAFELTEKKLDPKSAAARKPAPKSKIIRTKAGTRVGAKKAAANSASAPKAGVTKASPVVSPQKPAAAKPAPAAARGSSPKPSAAIAKPPVGTSSTSTSSN
jgi:cell division protein FtsQ